MSAIHSNKLETQEQFKAKVTGETLINFATVKQKTGFANSFLYQEISAGRFPAPVKIGAKASRWVLSEVQQWVADRIADRNASKSKKKSATVSL